ncbi:glycosyltransferase family 4 protein [Winogradskyella aurantia]|uniref:Glycosyltransferase WbuB n=1 Tax=Winogradskyella aurantia TaxID=1915063 RepID=A0A265UZT7_9FLAO|nr:glycosyltransferase family 4 protein [Winogradskyella aurantia]OZV70811.1 glycosyltransferase WbuB [Winogradskyella aurantia]
MKDIFIITSYYPPETGAASNRIFQLADGLCKQGYNVTVVTPLPNYPTGRIFKDYKGKLIRTSVENNITVHRLWIYASNSKNKVLRLLAMLSYGISLLSFYTFKKIPKIVIVQSPPLLVAFTSVLFLNKRNRKLILNVSDLWPKAGLDLGAFKKNFSYKVLEKIERFNYKNAHLVLGQSKEILSHVKSIFPNKQTFLYRNYPEFPIPEIPKTAAPAKKIKIVYAGLLGVAQGILKLCENLEYDRIEFHIYGAGAEENQITRFVKENKELPVYYHGEFQRKELHKELISYDLALIPLLNRIYGSVPSKIFEYAMLGLPLVYFGGGEGERIIKTYQLGWVAQEGNYASLNSVLKSIELKDVGYDVKSKIRLTAIKHFNFSEQLLALEAKI